jgi:hypothetical protein
MKAKLQQLKKVHVSGKPHLDGIQTREDTGLPKDLNAEYILDRILKYKTSWTQHFDYAMKRISQTINNCNTRGLANSWRRTGGLLND